MKLLNIARVNEAVEIKYQLLAYNTREAAESLVLDGDPILPYAVRQDILVWPEEA